MKYTKYQYKKKNNGIKLLTSLLMTTLSAISIGLLAAWLLLKVIPNIDGLKEVNSTPQIEENNNKENTSSNEEVERFTLIQCGYFSKEENAKQVLNGMNSDFNSFIVKDAEGKYRVLAGITTEENSSTLMQKLKEKGIENIKVNLDLNKNDEVENQISAITAGYLEILDTAGKEEVKEVNTSDFKKWTNDLEEISDSDKIEVLKEYKEHIKALPESINKNNIVSELEYIYSILSKI
ncbi:MULTISPECIES: SPOR domain-containing protein [unclassified Clostridium]|uniref:SPOR domain-containing protein n=1 Tax=unclassified Clostridium TaxID=2614128 RepID=UPI0025B809AE|nr:SPOR domain-containing protein [Clostridium sp.]MCI6693460.1 SPOR domain-containing protein [Clostridium sp.]MDY2629765.1 SPOR domain-containing protein [Clostridium sp.]MDY4251056.1 SPOR domain-containing protein [Clostridium sp.]MDY6226412.1 SPOR domain-containing protein [Clostridium sp.]